MFRSRASFNEAYFGQETFFSGCNFKEEISFTSSTFKSKTFFQNAVFTTHVPEFFEAVLYEYTDWYGSRWPEVPRNAEDARIQIQHYQRLILLMSDLHRPDEQHFFFRREMRVRRRTDGPSISAMLNLIYDLACDYGYGIGRIVAIWLLHILLGGSLMWISALASSSKRGWSWQFAHSSLSDFVTALGISFSNAHVLLGLDRTFLNDATSIWSPLPLVNVIGAVQAVLGVIVLFFLLLTLRNRFRMR